jgi:hypothetical protein
MTKDRAHITKQLQIHLKANARAFSEAFASMVQRLDQEILDSEKSQISDHLDMMLDALEIDRPDLASQLAYLAISSPGFTHKVGYIDLLIGIIGSCGALELENVMNMIKIHAGDDDISTEVRAAAIEI